MKNRTFAALLATAAAFLLLAVPAFAEGEPPAETAQPAAEVQEVQPEELQTELDAENEAAASDTATQSLTTTLPADIQVPNEPERQITYVALGDSITAGVGLSDIQYNNAPIGFDFQPNFEGYSSRCYTALVGKALGLDRQHAINLGLPGLMSPDMLDMVQNGAMPQMNQASGAYYVYPEYQEYLRKADIISIQIGSNDALVPCIVGLGNATNWKSEQLANLIVSGALRDFNTENRDALTKALKQLRLTVGETKATSQLLIRDMGEICKEAADTVTTNLPQIVAAIRALNPDAKIILLGYTNPVPMIPAWNSYFKKLNTFAKNLAAQEGLTYVAIPRTKTAADGHPTVAGHQYIAKQILSAIQ